MREDLQNEANTPLIDIHGEMIPALLHLLIFGKATPYLHNGTMPVVDENGEVSAIQKGLELQRPLNVITLGQTKSDNINRMITITGCFYLGCFINGPMKCDHNKRMITLTSDNIKRLSL
jgi:hypothetical protein